MQAACVQFYKRFIECPNFMAWFERRRAAAAAAWQVSCWLVMFDMRHFDPSVPPVVRIVPGQGHAGPIT